ncbi:MAG: DUF971 domain-containing protein [Gemmatimonadota bacterium]|nr:DUF971 domain-containing protein [Gemmatimonadota bacterium]MDH3367000.1 DUF971 domain-containing protein [Gemmatimonadota bacterium]MDH3476746.1 DUF971 domain-containing protein [Gemmatimonadota bacterium]MDH3571788.1 DUF971 domain-containing protein [Gemmatimonadota bacterium]MDH5550872.1 DUF971 domain-containing protein [Gemmatimonadota bacterium]
MSVEIPRQIHRGEREIVVTWSEHHRGAFPARWLRLHCQCAACVEEMSGRPLLDPDLVPGDVRPIGITLVGSYAIRVTWSDGHDTGIYTYEWMRRACPCDRCHPDGDPNPAA